MKFDEDYWSNVITQPIWYLEFLDFFKKSEAGLEGEELGRFRYDCRHFFERALQEGKVALAEQGPNLDEQRQPVDTIVIHHTSNKPGYRQSYLNAVHLLNIYAPYFASPTDKREESLKGQSIWSGHFYEGRQVFWGYHWLMRMDGSFERLLPDDKIGWHAGNWDINTRGIGICIDNDYEKMCPTDHLLKMLASHIKKNYPQVQPENIIGHQEARQGTICPGSHFIEEWKPKLIGYTR